MYRRGFLGVVAIPATSGCIGDVQNSAPSSGPDPEEVRENAETVKYDTLVRNINEYEGEPVHYSDARITDIPEHTESRQEFIAILNDDEWMSDKYFWCIWTDEPQFREDDRIEFYGVVDGLKTYKSVLGDQTVPQIQVTEIRKIRTVSV